jgi:hypothetical protein
MMRKLLTLAMAGIFVLSLHCPGRAQKEVAPPPIPPLLEGQHPLDHVEAKQPAAPRKVSQKKNKTKRKGKLRSRVKSKAKARAKYRQAKRRAKIKKAAAKRRRAVIKKRSRKTGKKKRPAVTRREAGPDAG